MRNLTPLPHGPADPLDAYARRVLDRHEEHVAYQCGVSISAGETVEDPDATEAAGIRAAQNYLRDGGPVGARLAWLVLAGFTGVPRELLQDGAIASRLERPATPIPMPPVVLAGDDVRVERSGVDSHGMHVLLVSDSAGRALATLRVTPTGAAALVSGLMPAAATAPRIVDALLTDLLTQDVTP